MAAPTPTERGRATTERMQPSETPGSLFARQIINGEITERASRGRRREPRPISTSITGMFAELGSIRRLNGEINHVRLFIYPSDSVETTSPDALVRSPILKDTFNSFVELSDRYSATPDGDIEQGTDYALRKVNGKIELQVTIPDVKTRYGVVMHRTISGETLTIRIAEPREGYRDVVEYERSDGSGVAAYRAPFQEYVKGDKYGAGQYGYRGYAQTGHNYVVHLYKPGSVETRYDGMDGLLVLSDISELAVGQ